ncbi:MAG: transketolase C-terminal domain-containing protein [Desulfurococcaceae archaeon]
MKIAHIEACRQAIMEEMERDDRIIYIGEDVRKGGPHGFSKGLYEKFGPQRVIDSPISEIGLVGFGIGAAIAGLKPIVEIMYLDFLPLAMEQVINHMAQVKFLSGGLINLPVVIRTQYSLGRQHGPQHSQFFPSLFTNIPGLNVVITSTPYNCKGLYKHALRQEKPTIIIDPAWIYYRFNADVPSEDYEIKFGRASIVNEGSDVTLITFGRTVFESIQAVKQLQNKASVLLVDLQSLKPLDVDTIVKSASHTGKVLIVSEEHPHSSVAYYVAAVIYEHCLNRLEKPIKILTPPDTHIPFSPQIEKEYMITADKISKSILELLCRSNREG